MTALLALVAGMTRVAAQTLPTPQNFRATADGSTVMLSWTQINDLYRFRIEAGSAPGLTDIASFSTQPIAAGSYFVVQTVPIGRYYVRLRTERDGQLSAPSNEAEVTVAGCAEPPAPPSLTASVHGQLVVVQWTFPSYPPGCFPSSLRLQAGRSPGASDVLDMNVPDWNITIRQFPSVPFGTYYLRAQVSRFGVPGIPSNEVRIDVGCLPPPAILNPQAEVVGNAARFSWGYGATQSADFSLSLEAGSLPGAANLASLPVPPVASAGFNVAGAAGTYFTRLRATNACGSSVSPELPVTLTAECVAPETIPFIDASMSYVPGSLNVRWAPPDTGGLVMTYNVDVGTAPGLSDLARRTVDGRYGFPPFTQTFNTTAQRAYLRITPVNACGVAPTPAEAHATAGPCPNPPAPPFISAQLNGAAVTLWWTGTSELEELFRTYVEIGRSPGTADVLTSPETTSYGSPSFTTTLPAGRYYARARRLRMSCDEVSNPSREVSVVIP